MSATDCFVDTGTLIYPLSADARKADVAEDLLAQSDPFTSYDVK